MTELAVERICSALASCVSIDELRDVVDKATAIRGYHRQRGASLRIQNQAAEIRLHAERRLGELLKAMAIRPGRKNPDEPVRNPSLEGIGITYRQSSTWQRIAAVEPETFEARIAEANDNGLELTTSRVLGLAQQRARDLVSAAEKAQREPEVMPVRDLARFILHHYSAEDRERLVSILSSAEPASTAA